MSKTAISLAHSLRSLKPQRKQKIRKSCLATDAHRWTQTTTAGSRSAWSSSTVKTSKLVPPLPDLQACQCSASAASSGGPSSGGQALSDIRVGRKLCHRGLIGPEWTPNTDRIPQSALTALALRALARKGFEQGLSLSS